MTTAPVTTTNLFSVTVVDDGEAIDRIQDWADDLTKVDYDLMVRWTAVDEENDGVEFIGDRTMIEVFCHKHGIDLSEVKEFVWRP